MIGKFLNRYVDTLFGAICRGCNILWMGRVRKHKDLRKNSQRNKQSAKRNRETGLCGVVHNRCDRAERVFISHEED